MPLYTSFAPYYDQIFPFREPTFTFLSNEAGSTGGAVLDIGCGTGSYCAAFSQAGFNVTGIDLDGGMIDFAKEKYSSSHFFVKDMRDIGEIDGRFDLIYSIGNVVSYLSAGALSVFLRSVYDLLNPNGRWIFQVVNWDYILEVGSFVFPEISPAGSSLRFIRQYKSITPEKVIFKTQLMKSEEVIVGDESTMYPITHKVYLQTHIQAGFHLAGHYGDYQRSEFLPQRNNANIFVFTK